jgi:hypothetical protein
MAALDREIKKTEGGGGAGAVSGGKKERILTPNLKVLANVELQSAEAIAYQQKFEAYRL